MQLWQQENCAQKDFSISRDLQEDSQASLTFYVSQSNSKFPSLERFVESWLCVHRCRFAGELRREVQSFTGLFLNKPSTDCYHRSRRCDLRFSRWSWCRRSACDVHHGARTDATSDPGTPCSAEKVSSMMPYRCWVRYVVGICCCSAQFCQVA